MEGIVIVRPAIQKCDDGRWQAYTVEGCRWTAIGEATTKARAEKIARRAAATVTGLNSPSQPWKVRK